MIIIVALPALGLTNGIQFSSILNTSSLTVKQLLQLHQCLVSFVNLSRIQRSLYYARVRYFFQDLGFRQSPHKRKASLKHEDQVWANHVYLSAGRNGKVRRSDVGLMYQVMSGDVSLPVEETRADVPTVLQDPTHRRTRKSKYFTSLARCIPRFLVFT